MQRIFKIKIAKPSSWLPPYIEENEEESEVPLSFRLVLVKDEYHYVCAGCLSAGGELDDIFRTSSLPESAWPFGDTGVPVSLAHEMHTHARQHEILWRWSVNRIPPPDAPVYDR